MTKSDDEGMQSVRDVREEISAEYGNDSKRLVDHYMAEQERYRQRLLGPVAAQKSDPADDALPDR